MIMQKKILIVEDNDINRAMLCEILAQNYQVLEAGDGREALDLLRARGEEIALVLLDIVMPVMDGYTFLSIVKADPDLSAIPVIVVTQSGSESDEVAALSHGAADFVAKPYKPQIILHRVAGIINLRETAAMVNQFQYDRLTGLYSKGFFYQRAREILRQHPGEKYDIICSDIENFKLINDVFGVPAGDRLLRGMADLYTELVGDRGICAHFNADQFCCMVEHRIDYEDEMFVQAGTRMSALSNIKNVIIKWGGYPVEEDRSVPIEQMCDRAILSARSIRGQYGRHFAPYDDVLRSRLLQEQAITDKMEDALAQGQFVIYLQPKYSIRGGRMAGAEALVRWDHPERGLLPPAEFVPLFEKNGFITQLDRYVWDGTCAILRRWADKGYPALPVSVNVSRADVYRSDLSDVLMRMVAQYNLPPSCLHLEITESAYTEDPDQLIATVRHLRQLGFVIEMDDFGNGYSSLNMLNQMPLDILKLDMKFIQSETAKPEDQGILNFIMGLARWMDLSVAAEGVETWEQLERLRGVGCDYVQGYYFAKPMPCEEFEVLLESGDPPAPVPGPAREDLPVLLVADEEPRYRAWVGETFREHYQVEGAADSGEALACVARMGHRIAAVLVSLTMPESAGFDLMSTLRREKSMRKLAVIATGAANADLEERALVLEADDFIGKPHTRESLRLRLRRAVGAVRSREREHLLKDEASRDYLTGLLNRRGLTAALQGIEEKDGPLAVYLFDLDHLKRINDTFGHREGDRMLRLLGAALQRHTRGDDILARYGGDEFVAVVKRMVSPRVALKKGEDICEALERELLPDGTPGGCSGGVYFCRKPSAVDGLLARADAALYRAKSERKGGCRLWEEGMDEHSES